MKKISLALVMLIACFLIPAASAETIIDEELYMSIDTSTVVTVDNPHTGGSTEFNLLILPDIQTRAQLTYAGVVIVGNAKPGGMSLDTPNTLTYSLGGVTRPCNVYYQYERNYMGSITATKMLVFFDQWDIGSLTGSQTITFSAPLLRGSDAGGSALAKYPGGYFGTYISGNRCADGAREMTITSYVEFKNRLIVTDDFGDYSITLKRVSFDKYYPSRIDLQHDTSTIFYNEGADDFWTVYPTSLINSITVSSSSGYLRSWSLHQTNAPSTNDTVTVYVRNSQTNALLANANLIIFASVNGNLHEVVNETVPSGIYSIDLQPTGGGMPNPDFYRLIATAEGYNSIMPYIDFEVDGATTIYAYLDPTGGAPEDENKTFIDFYVRDLAANGISGATVNFGGYTLITNSAGYTMFEVDKNNTYTWTVSKSGYGSLTGNAVIGSDGRHTINTVIAPAVTPTTPTPIPTSTPISPTPTMTSPTGEPVSNWLEWFAAHFGMILGGGAEIGKIFMWLCFAVPVGVYVGKEAKAGAAGFMAGAGIVTLFFVLIGWVPIWLLVLLALIIGLLYAKIFNNSDNGGGR